MGRLGRAGQRLARGCPTLPPLTRGLLAAAGPLPPHPVRPPPSLDVGLPDGTGDAEYLAAVSEALPRALSEFRPDLVLYDAGGRPGRPGGGGRGCQ